MEQKFLTFPFLTINFLTSMILEIAQEEDFKSYCKIQLSFHVNPTSTIDHIPDSSLAMSVSPAELAPVLGYSSESRPVCCL